MRFVDFTDFELNAHGTSIRGFKAGEGPPLLLLHGSAHSPQLWQAVAGRLAERHAIVVPDIGFDAALSSRASSLGHRELAAGQLAMMDALGFAQFMVCGHQEGARVAQRLALDHGGRVDRMMVLDTAPTLPSDHDVVPDPGDEPGANGAFALPYVVDSEHADRELTRGNLERGEKIACPVRVLWGGQGAWTVHPLDGWRKIARDTSGRALECAPCIPEQAPEALLDEMARFFDADAC